MAPLQLEGDNLGEKHRLFNELVKKNVTNIKFAPILTDDDDLRNLLTIEVAAANRNVDFILEVLKGEDMLYVSRALNRSTWLITDNQYAHIINPEYLYNKLFPHMTAKAINKLLLSIRLHLKDETRVEQFYNYFIINIEDRNVAFKWLQHCSVSFVDNEIKKHCDELPQKILSRLFEKSFLLFETAMSATQHFKNRIITYSEFLVGQDPVKYLDVIEKFDDLYFTFQNPKTTAHIMLRCPERVIENFEKYYDAVDIATFVKYLRKTMKVEDFLLEQAKNDKIKYLYRDNYLDHLIKFIPCENRIGLIKRLKSILKEMKEYSGCGIFYRPNLYYKIYKFAPFDVAFTELKKCIRVESRPRNRKEILIILLSTLKNTENVRSLLQYYFKNHFNEPYQFKIEFLNALLSKTKSHEIDEKMWNILDKLFHSLEIYTESEKDAQLCIQAIIVRSIVQGMNIPDIVQTKFVFDTLKTYEKQLKRKKDKDAVFSYLYHYVIKTIDNNKLESDQDFSEYVSDMNKLLNLLKDWKKDINEYPEIVNKIKQLIVTKHEKHYEADLTSFYNLNKKWRRTFFEESILLAPSDTTCMHVLKHDFNVLERHMEYLLSKIFCNDKIPLIDSLKKMRIYWPAKAKELKDIYLSRTDGADNFRALVTGLCVLLPQKELKVFVEKFAPTNDKLDWNETDEHVYFLRKNIAIRVHRARPLIPIDIILLYAKGDYLQYTVPSLCATLHQFSSTKSKQCMSKILDAPVSLQKFGIRYACRKFDIDDLITVFLQIWNSTKNPTIRTVVLTNIHKRLCQEKDESNIKNLWKMMSEFIDDLTSDENGIIYSKLSVSQNIPMTIKVEYFQKVYKFLASLTHPKFNRDAMLMRLKDYSCDIMDKLDDHFVADYILNDIWDKIVISQYFWNEDRHFATYLLQNKDEETQVRRYNIFFNPILEKCLLRWTEKNEGRYGVIDQTRLLLRKLIRSLKSITIDDKMAIPLELFRNIQTQLENGLTYERNYKLLTYWKLATELIRLFNENKHILESDGDIKDLCTEVNKMIAPSFARYCVESIKEDVNQYSPSILQLFTSALDDLFRDIEDIFVTTPNQLEYFKYMLECEQNREVYLMVISLIERFYESCYDNRHNKPVEKSVLIEIQHLLYFYPTEEMKMHYYDLISNSQFLV